MDAYRVRLEAFEGPLDLLMHLIEKNKIDIYDIPIAALTEQYLAYLEQFKEFDLEIASEFLVMAATLLQIKSRVLLPKPPAAIDSGEEEEDPRQELVARLLEYRRFKEICASLEALAEAQAQVFTRAPQPQAVRYAPLRGLEIGQLIGAFQAVLEASVDETALVSREEFNIQDKIADILLLLYKRGGELPFGDVFTRAGTRAEVIASFLALLELMKRRRIGVRQEGVFTPIFLRLRDGEKEAGEGVL